MDVRLKSAILGKDEGEQIRLGVGIYVGRYLRGFGRDKERVMIGNSGWVLSHELYSIARDILVRS